MESWGPFVWQFCTANACLVPRPLCQQLSPWDLRPAWDTCRCPVCCRRCSLEHTWAGWAAHQSRFKQRNMSVHAEITAQPSHWWLAAYLAGHITATTAACSEEPPGATAIWAKGTLGSVTGTYFSLRGQGTSPKHRLLDQIWLEVSGPRQPGWWLLLKGLLQDLPVRHLTRDSVELRF